MIRGYGIPAGCLLVLVLSVLVLSAHGAARPASAGQGVPKLADAAELESLIAEGGATVSVVNFWATWCPPCRAELSEFTRLSKEFEGRDVQVIGVSFDYDPAALERFLSKFPLGYPNYLGDNELMEELGVGVIPKTVIYSPAGNLVAVHEGEIKAVDIRSRIIRLLGHGGKDVN